MNYKVETIAGKIDGKLHLTMYGEQDSTLVEFIRSGDCCEGWADEVKQLVADANLGAQVRVRQAATDKAWNTLVEKCKSNEPQVETWHDREPLL